MLLIHKTFSSTCDNKTCCLFITTFLLFISLYPTICVITYKPEVMHCATMIFFYTWQAPISIPFKRKVMHCSSVGHMTGAHGKCHDNFKWFQTGSKPLVTIKVSTLFTCRWRLRIRLGNYLINMAVISCYWYLYTFMFIRLPNTGAVLHFPLNNCNQLMR